MAVGQSVESTALPSVIQKEYSCSGLSLLLGMNQHRWRQLVNSCRKHTPHLAYNANVSVCSHSFSLWKTDRDAPKTGTPMLQVWGDGTVLLQVKPPGMQAKFKYSKSGDTLVFLSTQNETVKLCLLVSPSALSLYLIFLMGLLIDLALCRFFLIHFGSGWFFVWVFWGGGGMKSPSGCVVTYWVYN